MEIHVVGLMNWALSSLPARCDGRIQVAGLEFDNSRWRRWARERKVYLNYGYACVHNL